MASIYLLGLCLLLGKLPPLARIRGVLVVGPVPAFVQGLFYSVASSMGGCHHLESHINGDDATLIDVRERLGTRILTSLN